MKYRNEMDFDYMDNYRALLACILAEQEITIESAMSLVAREKIGNRGRNRTSNSNMLGRNHFAIEVYVIDTLDNDVFRFDSLKDAAGALGLSRSTISINLDKDKLVRKRYKFTTEEPKNN